MAAEGFLSEVATCAKCGRSLPVLAFNRLTVEKKRTRQAWCSDCNRDYCRSWSRWKKILQPARVFLTRRTPHEHPGTVYAWYFRLAGIVKGPSCTVNGAESRRREAIAEVFKHTRVADLEPVLLFEVPADEPYKLEQFCLGVLRRHGIPALWGREYHAAEHRSSIEAVVQGRLA